MKIRKAVNVKYKIFETHAHYDDESFDEDRDSLIEEILSTDVEYITNIGADLFSSGQSVLLAKKHEKVLAVVGVHPDMIGTLERLSEEEVLGSLKELAAVPKVVAIGEIGLDYYERSDDEKPEAVRNAQKFWLKKQIELANELDLPVVIHSRDAGEDTYLFLKENEVKKKGVIHCFSYSAEMAEKFVKLGYFIGMGGVVTFKNARKAIEVVKKVGIENLVLETDSPYLAPVPYRGKRNNSSYIRYVVEKIAEILELSEEEVLEKTYKNAKKLYHLKEA